MNTALATQQTSIDEQSLILPNKREALLIKLNQIKVNNLNAREQEGLKKLAYKSTDLFIRLCWSKIGVSLEQLKKLEQQDLNELAGIVSEQSRTCALVHTGILVCIPVVGWIILFASLEAESSDNVYWHNMRYYWWYKIMKNRYGRDLEPSLKEEQK